jgi:sugar fermentation stimulation protein A
VRIEGEWVEGRFLARDNRFRVTVEIGGQEVKAHLPNSGRLGELLVPGRRAMLLERLAPGRRTRYDLALVQMEEQWVSVDARLPNKLVEEALGAGSLPSLSGYAAWKREVGFGTSRLDFLLQADGRRPCLVEVKSVTLVTGGLACFPDAVTARGRRHVNELADALGAGYRAMVLFVVQRADADVLRPHDESDPYFGRALRRAARQGVEVDAYTCQVGLGCIKIDRRLPVLLDPAQEPLSAVSF